MKADIKGIKKKCNQFMYHTTANKENIIEYLRTRKLKSIVPNDFPCVEDTIMYLLEPGIF